MAIYFLFTGALFALTIGENVADMSCHLSKVDGKPNKFAFHLWGRDIVRDCPGDKVFDVKKCRCDTEKLEANEIVNGDQVHIHDVPWIVSIGMKCPIITNGQPSHQKIGWHCTGSLIRPQWVLSAKHCEDDMYTNCKKYNPPLPYYDTRKPTLHVEAGVSQYGVNQGEKVEVTATYKHDVHTSMDIMLLHLETAIHLTHNSQLIPVMTPGSTFWGKRCMIVGFGYQVIDEPNKIFQRDTHLYKAETTVLYPSRNCPRGHYKNIVHEDWYICTQDEEGITNICGGDSGGPLVCDDRYGVKTLVGVLSQGDKKCRVGKPTVYVNMESFYDRMMAVINRVEGSG